MTRRSAALILVALGSVTASANDGPVLAIPAGGIQFQKTDIFSMDKEDLYITEDKIRVNYVFRNTSDKEFKTEIAFPLPIYSLDEFEGEKPNYAQFTVVVNGKPVEYRTLERAVLCAKPDKEWAAPSRDQWKVEKDITDAVTKHKLPIGDPMQVWESLDKLSPAAKDDLIAAGALKRETIPASAVDGPNAPPEVIIIPQWKVQTAYLWEQTFPANAETRVEHEYVPQVGYSNETHLEPYVDLVYNGKMEYDKVPKFGTAEFNAKCAGFLKRFDIDDTIQKWAERQRNANKRFGFSVVDYVLTTANYWKGPIKDFTLTIVKPTGPEPVVMSTALTGINKVSDGRFEWKQTNFAPEKDLSILFIHAYEEF